MQLSTLALGVTTLLAMLSPGAAAAPASADADIAALRARGPAVLAPLLERYDHAAAAERPALATLIDGVAGQRYATVSRLYWYTDLGQAIAAAHDQHRPILALRMLGDLRDDLSCANSRLFRATLYANRELADYLRQHFVLYWSSERPVPKVTIDYGDGRKLVRTTTGNSVHYVLDEDGHVLDALPGLYAPKVFQQQLAAVLGLAARVHGQPARERAQTIAAFHQRAIAATDRAWHAARGTEYNRDDAFLNDARRERSQLVRAQRATMSKMVVEAPDLRAIGLIAADQLPDNTAGWAAMGQKLWGIFPAAPAKPHAPQPGVMAWVGEVPDPAVLDVTSRALVEQLHNAGPAALRADAPTVARVIARLEQHIVADTALNELTLHQRIRRELADQPAIALDDINKWIYDDVFATPASDPWMGLVPRDQFSGLPGDGVVLP